MIVGVLSDSLVLSVSMAPTQKTFEISQWVLQVSAVVLSGRAGNAGYAGITGITGITGFAGNLITSGPK